MLFPHTWHFPSSDVNMCKTGGEELRGAKQKTWRHSMSQAGTAWIAITAVVPGQEANACSLRKRQVDGGFGKCS